MAESRVEPVAAVDEREARKILREIDSHDSVQDELRWVEKRYTSRRGFRRSCRIRHIGPDGTTVLTTSGMTRDISPGGLGFVAPHQFEAETPLLITLSLPGGATKSLTATVRHCRVVRDEWCHTGIAFEPLEDDRLAPDPDGASAGR